jgi:hypothetical protein
MLPTLNFFGNHALDFVKYDTDDLEYFTISELRTLSIPGDILQIVHNSLISQFQGGDLSMFLNIKDWSPVSFPGTRPELQKKLREHILTIGPMGMRLVFTPHHIILPSVIYERVDWYSPTNKEKVQSIRSYYYAIINHFGGDHALYVDERITDKFDFPQDNLEGSAMEAFEQSLIGHYGKIKKSMFDYAHGKYPKYYIDTFNDIKQSN